MKLFYVLLMIISVSGCDQSSFQTKAKIGNQEVNCLKVDFGIDALELMERISLKKKTHDLELLKRIHLPANASLCEIRDFVDLILYASQNQVSYRKEDPQVNMIKLAIRGNEDEFIAIAKDWGTPNSYVKHALVILLSDKSKKEMVRNNLGKYLWLIQVIVKNGWSKEFRKEIESVIIKYNGKVSYNYGAALAQINDPKTEDLLLSIFRGGTGNRHVTYSLIKDIEWFDPIPVMKEIWLSDDVSDLEIQYFAYALLIRGFFPALDYKIKNIDGYASNSHYHKNHELLNAITNNSLEKDELEKWLKKNREKLKFDTNSKKYHVSSN